MQAWLIRHRLSDNPISQQLLVKILQRVDLTVFATSNGNEAISGISCLLLH